MGNLFDEFSKSLAEPVFGVPVFGRPVSRRETLRRLGAVFAGAVLAPLGLATAAWPVGRAIATPATSVEPAETTTAATCRRTRTAGPAATTASSLGRPVAAITAPISTMTNSTADDAAKSATRRRPSVSMGRAAYVRTRS